MTGLIIPACFVSQVIPLIVAGLRLAVLFPFIVLVDREISAGFHLVLPYPMGPQSQCRTFCKLLSVSVPPQELAGVHCDLKLGSESLYRDHHETPLAACAAAAFCVPENQRHFRAHV